MRSSVQRTAFGAAAGEALAAVVEVDFSERLSCTLVPICASSEGAIHWRIGRYDELEEGGWEFQQPVVLLVLIEAERDTGMILRCHSARLTVIVVIPGFQGKQQGKVR